MKTDAVICSCEVWVRFHVDAGPDVPGVQTVGSCLVPVLVYLGVSSCGDEDLESLRASLLGVLSSASASWPRVQDLDVRAARGVADGVLAAAVEVQGLTRRYTVEVYRLGSGWERLLTLTQGPR